MTLSTKKQNILFHIAEAADDIVLSNDEIDEAEIKELFQYKVVTVDECVAVFRESLEKAVPRGKSSGA